MMQQILTELAGSGILGGVLAYFIYSNKKLTDKVINLVENNTEAMTELKNSINHLKE